MTLTGFPDDSAVCAAFFNGNLLQNEKKQTFVIHRVT